MSEIEPITREELLLNSIAGEGDSGLSPITRQEMYLSAIAGESDLPSGMEPITREEIYYQKILDNGGAGGGGEAEGTVQISITQNGTITRNVARYASAEITTNVPNPSTGTKNITTNGDHDVTQYATAHVDVPTGITPSGSQTYTQNGTYDVTNLAEAVVNVASSGGVTKVEGDFTIVTQGRTTPVIVHNFGTQKIAALIYPTSDEIVATGGYINYYAMWMNVVGMLEGTEWVFDWTSYNSHHSEKEYVTIESPINLRTGVVHQSPYSTQTGWSIAGNPATIGGTLNPSTNKFVQIDNNSVQIRGTGSVGGWVAGTYHYIVWKLGD